MFLYSLPSTRCRYELVCLRVKSKQKLVIQLRNSYNVITQFLFQREVKYILSCAAHVLQCSFQFFSFPSSGKDEWPGFVSYMTTNTVYVDKSLTRHCDAIRFDKFTSNSNSF